MMSLGVVFKYFSRGFSLNGGGRIYIWQVNKTDPLCRHKRSRKTAIWTALVMMASKVKGKTMIFHFILCYDIFVWRIALKIHPAYIYVYAELSLHGVVEFTSFFEPFLSFSSRTFLTPFFLFLIFCDFILMRKRFTGGNVYVT